MASMVSVVSPLLLLVAACYCAPANLLDVGGTVGYDSVMNGTIGGGVKIDRDGLSLNGTGKGIIGASWNPTLAARGHANIGSMKLAGDGSLSADINNSWQPGMQAALGVNSNGTFIAEANPYSTLYNRWMLTPNIRLKTGADADKLNASPLFPTQNNQDQPKFPQPGALPSYPAMYPGMFNPAMYTIVNGPYGPMYVPKIG